MPLSTLLAISELWEAVVTYLQPTDLASLLLTSRSINAATEEHFYRHIYWSFSHSPPKPPAHLQRLLVNFLQQPHLARHVHTAHFEEHGYGPKPDMALRAHSVYFNDARYDMQEDDQGAFTQKEEALLRQYLQETGFDNKDEWMARLLSLDCESIIALLILQLHNVRKLTINLFWRTDDSTELEACRMLGQAMHVAFKDAHRYKHLAEVFWPGADFDCSASCIRRGEVSDMLAVLQAPHLKSASLILSDSPSEFADVQSIPSMSSLTSLSLPFTSIAEKTLVPLLASMTRLQVFSLTLLRDENNAFQGARLREALLSCRTTLRRLRLDMIYLWSAPSAEGLATPLGSLQDFPALQHVEAMFEMLTIGGWQLKDVLPRGLQTLNIWPELDVESEATWDQIMGPQLESLLSVEGLGLRELSVGTYDELSDTDVNWQLRGLWPGDVTFELYVME